MSAILEEGIGFGGNDNSSNTSTDVIISQYEHKLSKSIAFKTLESTKNGTPPLFTKEELSYLSKKSEGENTNTEIEVITPDPIITLKKGNTELNIKNATTLFKKMEEIYPSPSRKKLDDVTVVQSDVDNLVNELVTLEKTPDVVHDLGVGIKARFSKIVNFPAKDVSPEVSKCVAADEKTFQSTDFKTVNKNAYEIRADVLGMALDWVRFKKESGSQPIIQSDDDVLSTAQKFYKFVENRR